jgi:hypothetical protein
LKKDELPRKRSGHSIRQVERLPSTTSEVILASTGDEVSYLRHFILWSLFFTTYSVQVKDFSAEYPSKVNVPNHEHNDRHRN